MYTMNASCTSCGYATGPALWGPPGLFQHNLMGIPVYLPDRGELKTHTFDREEIGVPDEEYDEWLRDNVAREIAALYGADAIALDGSLPDGHHLSKCPRCAEGDLKLIYTGMH
jgi:hypothetical protein